MCMVLESIDGQRNGRSREELKPVALFRHRWGVFLTHHQRILVQGKVGVKLLLNT